MTTKRTTIAGVRSSGALLMFIGGCVTPGSPGLHLDVGVPNTVWQTGAYATPIDFEAGRLANAIECRSASQPPDRQAFRHAAVVEMQSASGRTRISKGTIYGWRTCDGIDVRFVRGEDYRVVRAPPLYLYQHERTVFLGKTPQVRIDFSFSVSAADSVRPLTKNALKAAYPDNHRFHDLLDLAFRRDEELVEYDDFHHEYRVARLLRQVSP